ncbi:hypothetical protein EYF80_001710 [Liparis tanakae]|uniref:Uncharacterized protein n=1 Tax=Liparis tanakae TaxID=230148 RepID=A0A4Z2JD28_9TELE|nr:hypothetical protein EYF80_001710 [Liparis tanakae]
MELFLQLQSLLAGVGSAGPLGHSSSVIGIDWMGEKPYTGMQADHRLLALRCTGIYLTSEAAVFAGVGHCATVWGRGEARTVALWNRLRLCMMSFGEIIESGGGNVAVIVARFCIVRPRLSRSHLSRPAEISAPFQTKN